MFLQLKKPHRNHSVASDKSKQVQVECFYSDLWHFAYNQLHFLEKMFLCRLNALDQAPRSNPLNATNIYTKSHLCGIPLNIWVKGQEMNQT